MSTTFASGIPNRRFRRPMAMFIRSVVALALLCLALTGVAQAQTRESQRHFPTAQDAADALYNAAKSDDQSALIGLFGAAAKDWIFSGDAVEDRTMAAKFAAAYEEKHALETKTNDSYTLVVGNDSYPFPFPIFRTGGRWMFDADEGRQELLRRRIGRNELNTIQVLLAIVDAQREYASQLHDGRRAPEYADKFMSTPGKHDGLYWPTLAGEQPSPLGPLVADAVRAGYTLPSGQKPEDTAYYGYYYHMLTGQGPNANGGAYSYVVNGRMIGGFGVIAYPATYGVSGIMTFVVNSNGTVYAKNLGPKTTAVAATMQTYNPDSSWKKQE